MSDLLYISAPGTPAPTGPRMPEMSTAEKIKAAMRQADINASTHWKSQSGMPRKPAFTTEDLITQLQYITPGVGDVMAAKDASEAYGRAGDAFSRGDYGQAAISGLKGFGDQLTTIPGIGEIAGVGKALSGGLAGLVGMIGGRHSPMADLDMLAKAQEMKAAGATDDEIFKATATQETTGWWLGHPDQKPRFEFSDSTSAYNKGSGMRLREHAHTAARKRDPAKYNELRDAYIEFNLQNSMNKKDYGKLQSAEDEIDRIAGELGLKTDEYYASAPMNLKHDTLYKAYPQLKTAIIDEVKMSPNDYGSYSEKNRLIEINKSLNTPEMHSTALHEINHAIEGMEDFARGGNKDQFIPEIKQEYENTLAEIANIQKHYSDLVNSQKASGKTSYTDDMLEALDELKALRARATHLDKNMDSIAFKRYQNLPGEQQARLVEYRAPMTLDELRAHPFYKEYGSK